MSIYLLGTPLGSLSLSLRNELFRVSNLQGWNYAPAILVTGQTFSSPNTSALSLGQLWLCGKRQLHLPNLVEQPMTMRASPSVQVEDVWQDRGVGIASFEVPDVWNFM